MQAMKFSCVLAFALILSAGTNDLKNENPGSQPAYDQYFNEKALRIDLVHSGTKDREVFGLDSLTVEPVWPGTRAFPIDTSNMGDYRFRVFDAVTKKEIYRQGYCSLFGEWLTTEDAAKGGRSSMSEPLRIPMPKAPIVLAVESRTKNSAAFEEIQRFEIDPTASNAKREYKADLVWIDLFNGDRSPVGTLDIVIVPEGYTAEEASKMDADARRFADILMTESPFQRNREKIAIRMVKAFSKESETDEPTKGIFRDTVVNTAFDTFGSARYLTTFDMHTLREVAANAPYDAIIVMVNSSRYGGGGVFNSFSIFVSDNEYSEYIMIHEFGHGLAGLGDEYFDSLTSYDEDLFYPKDIEPWSPNLTIAKSKNTLKWKQFLTPGIPIPTPDTDMYDNAVGLFEGGGYKAKGIFRPTRDSKMRHKGNLGFGSVSEAAIEATIRYYTDEELKK